MRKPRLRGRLARALPVLSLLLPSLLLPSLSRAGEAGAEAEDAWAREAEKTAASIRKAVVRGVARGRREIVYVDFGGKALRARILKADDERLVVSAGGVQPSIPWAQLRPVRLYNIGRKYVATDNGGAHLALARYCVVHGLIDEAEEALSRVLELDPSLSGDVKAARERIAAGRGSAGAAQKASPKADGGAVARRNVRPGDWDSRLFDKTGAIKRGEYLRMAASLDAATVNHRLGPDYEFYHPTEKKKAERNAKQRGGDGEGPKPKGDGLPGIRLRFENGEYVWKQKGEKAVDWTGQGGQCLFVPDDPKGPGVDRMHFIWSYHENHGPANFWHVYRLRPATSAADGGEWWSTLPDPVVKARGFAEACGRDRVLVPTAVARARSCYSHQGVIVFRNGVVSATSTGNNGNEQHVFINLPVGKVPTDVAVTSNNEFALVTVWDIREVKGQLAVVALGGHPWLRPQDAHPWMIPSPGFYNRLKLLGFVDLPFATPTKVSASLDLAIQDGFMFGVGKEDFDFSKADVRAAWLAGEPGAPRNGLRSYARAGYAAVISRPEGAVAFVDLSPLLGWVRKSYFTTQEEYEKTRNAGPDPRQWPFAFELAPVARPKVVKTIDVTAPTAVAAGYAQEHSREFATKAVVATMDGKLVVFELGRLASSTAKPAPIAAVGLTRIGRNPTCFSYGSRFLAPKNSMLTTCRGDRTVVWFKVDGREPQVIKVLRDARLEDPVSVQPSESRGAAVFSVADFKGRQVVNYLYKPINSWGAELFGGLGEDGTADFECTGSTSLPGYPFALSCGEIP